MNSWNHKWFNFWVEDGTGYELCPSIHNYKNRRNYQDVEKIIGYLHFGSFVCGANLTRSAIYVIICLVNLNPF